MVKQDQHHRHFRSDRRNHATHLVLRIVIGANIVSDFVRSRVIPRDERLIEVPLKH